MKLLEAINDLSVSNLTKLNDIQFTLEMRLDWLNDREPESCGMVYDEWQEKVDDLQEILDYIDSINKSIND